MNDKELLRNLKEIRGRLDRIEDTKPNEIIVGSALDKKLESISEATKLLPTGMATLTERVNNHIKFVWGVGGFLFLLALGFAGNLWSQQLAIAKMEATLSVFQLEITESGTLTEKKLRAAREVVAKAKRAGTRIDPQVLSTVASHIIEASPKSTPALSSLAGSTVADFASYRSTLNSEALPVLPGKASSFTKALSYFEFPSTNPPKLEVYGEVPRAQAAVFQPIGKEINQALEIGQAYVVVNGGDVTLDGMEMKNVIFRNVHIQYEGGPVRLNGVWFVDCTFDPPKNDNGREFALAVISSQLTKFDAS